MNAMNFQWSAILLAAALLCWCWGETPFGKRRVLIGVLSLLGLLVFSFGYAVLRNPVRTFQDPVTGRTFAMEMRHTHPLRTRGYAVYYERIGIFLLHPQATEWENTILWGDRPFVSISERGIWVNYTFMGYGATFPFRPGELEQVLASAESLSLHWEGQGEEQRIIVERDAIRWLRNGSFLASDEYDARIPITAAQYEEIRGQLENLPLVEERTFPRYVLRTPRELGDTFISVQVDGAAMFEILLAFMDRGSGN